MTDPIQPDARFPRHDELIAHARRQAERLGGAGGDASVPTGASNVPLPGIDNTKYTVVSELHRGAQGVVYLANQHRPQRQVAIKVVRQGLLSTRSERLRFQREIEMLGSLRHPHIVAVHDSGGEGAFLYYVMDYVDGPPLDAYVSGRRATYAATRHGSRFVDETVRLFVKVCDAVQAAHLRGIIHRDLKPENIRVDGRGEPRVLDFGLAKAISEEASPKATVTAVGQFVGTLAYASPEQAEGVVADLDVRTDVYSLGVILFELLTDQLPYDTGTGLSDALANIKTHAPRKPSSIAPNLPRDVEVILLKALQKDPDRRYQTAGELAADLRRCLSGEPIDARRDSAWYVLRKQLARHKMPVAAAALLVIVIVGGLVVSTMFWRRAVRENLLAQRETRKTLAVNEFLYEILSSADPFRRPGEATTVRQILKNAEARLDAGAFSRQPEVESAVRNTLGMSLLAIEQNDAAIQQLNSVLEARRNLAPDDSLAIAESQHNLGRAYFQSGDYDQAERFFREATRRRAIDEATDPRQLAESMYWIGTLHLNRGEIDAADQAFREAMTHLEQEDPADIRAQCLKGLSAVAGRRGEMDRAVVLAREAYDARRERFGDHPYVADALMTLGNALGRTGDYTAALQSYVDAIDMCRRHLVRHPALAGALTTAGKYSERAGEYERALEYSREGLEMFRDFYPDTDRRVTATLGHISGVLRKLGRLDEAESVRRESLNLSRQAGHRIESAIAAIGLSTILQDAGRLADAEAVLNEAIDLAEHETRPLPASVTGQLLVNLAHIIYQQGRPLDAEPLARRALDLFHSDSLERNPWMPDRKEVHLILAGNVLGRCQADLGQFGAAEETLLGVDQLLDRMTPLSEPMERQRDRNIRALISLYEAWHGADPEAGHVDSADLWRHRLQP